MAEIELLDEQTIDKIAAGEVVERPSSVVKELVENAIDAGASAVTVEIRDGGTTMVRVTDNGTGIEKEQIRIAFASHSTSKIRSADDLMTISSLGFRGEALSSIAAVSRVEMITKTAESFAGSRYLIEGGKELSMEEAGAPEGTTFIVRDLFYNTPARKKFLKTPQTEAGYIGDMMDHIALSHPEVSFKFVSNGQVRLHTSGNSRLMDVIYQVYGRDISSNLLEINGSFGSCSVCGYIGKPVIARGNRGFENYFINGRYVRSGLIAKTIEDGYQGFLMQHKYPFVVLMISLDGRLVDVNVHPSKMEIRFSNGEEIYEQISGLIRRTLSERELIAEAEEKKASVRPAYAGKSIPEPFEKKRIERSEILKAQESEKRDESPAAEESDGRVQPAEEEKSSVRIKETRESLRFGGGNSRSDNACQMELSDYTGEETRLLSAEARPRHRVIGQLFNTYWLVEFDDRLFMIDQHAAHEKVLYEEMMHAWREKELYSQLVSPPIVMTLTAREETTLNRYLEDFKNLGFSIESYGGRDYAVRAVPANIYGLNGQDLLSELIDGMNDITDKDTPDMVAGKIASMSCKAAVKGSHSLSRAEADRLIDDLMKLENPYFCPHGRPVIISMTRYEIEKRFKRLV